MCAIACRFCQRVKRVANILLLTDFKPIRFFSAHFSFRYLTPAHFVQRFILFLSLLYLWLRYPLNSEQYRATAAEIARTMATCW